MRFFLGTHMPQWLADPRFVGVPLFISRRILAERVSLPAAMTDFALDSGGFTELQMFGRWTMTATDYAAEVRRLRHHFGPRLLWCAPQDWMCEPAVIAGGKMGPLTFAGTGLSVEEHQRRTVANYLELRALIGDLVIPVLQGWRPADYYRHEEMYAAAGVDLAACHTVGVGSVCRRQAMNEATLIMRSLASSGLRLHGFGFKKLGVEANHEWMASADSMAWSFEARRSLPLPGHDKPGDGRTKGHKNCANCAEWALRWRGELLAGLERAKAQQSLPLCNHCGRRVEAA